MELNSVNYINTIYSFSFEHKLKMQIFSIKLKFTILLINERAKNVRNRQNTNHSKSMVIKIVIYLTWYKIESNICEFSIKENINNVYIQYIKISC
jgi:hypothetical protein